MKLFDKSDLLDRLGDDEDFCKEIIELFIEDTPHQISELKKAIENNDASMVHQKAHSLKGSSAQVSALSMQEIAFQMEQAGEAGNVDRAATLMSEFEEEFEKFTRLIAGS
jgi:HPt (histidine-containing phosphotransfer) domain-containing protein